MEIGFRQVGAEPEESEIRGVEVVLSRSMRISCSIVSKAAGRSKFTKAAARPMAQISWRPFVTCRNALSVEWCSR